MKIGIVMDPIASITFKKDTSLALLMAAAARGHSLFYMEMPMLHIKDGEAIADAHPLHVFDDPNKWFELGPAVETQLGELDVILMRVDPPFDSQYIYATYILEIAERKGCLVVNKPQSLRDCNEKVFATQFPQCCPPVLVSKDSQTLKRFHEEHKQTIFKPLDGMGGTGIFHCTEHDKNVSVIIETLTENGQSFIMAQKYLPEIKEGDKRILMVNGEAIPYALARIPASGETRGNIAAGGTGRPQPLSERDKWIASQVGPTLREKGLYFVGLDVIGDYLTEINVTSPTCVREIDAAYDTKIGEKLIMALESVRENG